MEKNLNETVDTGVSEGNTNTAKTTETATSVLDDAALSEAYHKECHERLDLILQSEINQKRFHFRSEYERVQSEIKSAEELYKTYLENDELDNMLKQSDKIDKLKAEAESYHRILEKYAAIPIYPDDDLIAIGADMNQRLYDIFKKQENRLIEILKEALALINNLYNIEGIQNGITYMLSDKSDSGINMSYRLVNNGTTFVCTGGYANVAHEIEHWLVYIDSEEEKPEASNS